jgi:hypothetical protein
MRPTFEQIPPSPLYKRGAEGGFLGPTAYVNSIGLNSPSSQEVA